MKRLILYLMTGLCMVSATAQNVTYNHDAAKQNQFTVTAPLLRTCTTPCCTATTGKPPLQKTSCRFARRWGLQATGRWMMRRNWTPL